MARPQMLYVGKQGALTYPAIGNVETGVGSKGTAAFWYHPSAEGQHCYVLQVTADSENWLVVRRDQADWVLQSYSSGASAMVISASDVVAWRHVVATWDFTTPGDGVLRLHLDGEEVPESPATGAPELQGPPDTIHVGPGSANQYTLAHAVFDELAIWNEVMTPEQVSALHEAGRMHIPQAEDGSGALLFRASWDEQYDAEVAEGDGTASFDGAADQYCRLDCGSRHRGKRFAYRLGTPKHDGSEDDRVPVMAVLQRTKYGTVESANTDEYGTLEVDASGNGHTVGAWLAPWLPGPEAPMTLRLGLHVPRDSAPEGPPIGVGAHDYFLGSGRRLTCASGCTTDTIYSPHLLEEDGYWAGGELSVLTGEADNEKQKVIGYSVADRSLTLGGQLSAAPAEGDVAIVAKPIRVEPVEGGSLYRLEADLSEEHDYIPRFAVLETAIAGERGYTCINHGRIQAFPGLIDRTDVFFGKREATVYDSWVLTVMIERVEMDGPGTYQRTEATDDTFLVVDPQKEESIKLWRQEGLVRETRQPEQYPTPSDIVADITEPGSWREALYHWPSWMEYDAVNEELLALVPGEDAAGEVRIGWVRGSWDEETGRVAWRDDPHPQNPMFTLDELQAATGGTSELFSTVGGVNGAFEVAEGDWALTFMATIGNPDGMVCCALTGAPDRYSFDPAKHFDRDLNPLKLPLAGDDRVLPDGSGIGLYGNRDVDTRWVHNPWARDRGERFWAYGRAKTINHEGYEFEYQPARPLSCLVTGDFRNVRTLPWRNQLIVPCFAYFHWPHPEWFGPSTVGLVVDDGGVTQSNVNLWASEDGVHLARTLGQALIPKNSPPFNSDYLQPQANPVRLGRRRLYWYRSGKGGSEWNLATIRLDGEALYRLETSATEGVLETCELSRSGEVWDELRVNAAPEGGSLEVSVLDAATGEPVPGFDYEDCDAVTDDVEQRVSWASAGLSEVTCEQVKLRFRLRRPTTGDASPELYAWTIAPPQDADRPTVATVEVEGKSNPVRVANPQPELSWEYEDRLEREQTAYHVLVSSSEEKLDSNEGDLWDTGVVLSGEHEVKYGGVGLDSERTYFWKVRVRNSEGVWSEEW